MEEKVPNINAKDTVFKEAADFSEAMRWKLLYVGVVAILRIVGAHGDDLIILLTL